MYIFRFFIILLTLIISNASLVSAADISPQTRASYILGLKAPIRLPIFYDDASYMRFVSRTTPLSETTYAPTDLVSIS